jgi:hypothetical protein
VGRAQHTVQASSYQSELSEILEMMQEGFSIVGASKAISLLLLLLLLLRVGVSVCICVCLRVCVCVCVCRCVKV